MACAGWCAPGRAGGHDLPPWGAVYRQTQRRLKAGVFEALGHDLRAVALGRGSSRPVVGGDPGQSHPAIEPGKWRAGYDGAKRKKGSKVQATVDTLGQLLALYLTPANAQDRAQVAPLAHLL